MAKKPHHEPPRTEAEKGAASWRGPYPSHPDPEGRAERRKAGLDRWVAYQNRLAAGSARRSVQRTSTRPVLAKEK